MLDFTDAEGNSVMISKKLVPSLVRREGDLTHIFFFPLELTSSPLFGRSWGMNQYVKESVSVVTAAFSK